MPATVFLSEEAGSCNCNGNLIRGVLKAVTVSPYIIPKHFVQACNCFEKYGRPKKNTDRSLQWQSPASSLAPHHCCDPMSRCTVSCTQRRGKFPLFLRCCVGVALYPPKTLSHLSLSPPFTVSTSTARGVASRFPSKNRLRYTGVSEPQCRMLYYSLQRWGPPARQPVEDIKSTCMCVGETSGRVSRTQVDASYC